MDKFERWLEEQLTRCGKATTSHCCYSRTIAEYRAFLAERKPLEDAREAVVKAARLVWVDRVSVVNLFDPLAALCSLEEAAESQAAGSPNMKPEVGNE